MHIEILHIWSSTLLSMNDTIIIKNHILILNIDHIVKHKNNYTILET